MYAGPTAPAYPMSGPTVAGPHTLAGPNPSGTITQPAAASVQPVSQPENVGSTTLLGHTTILPHAFTVGTLHDPVSSA
ncbi:hypothetical protein Tco_1106592 [Tanacetum coccineum]